MQVPCVSRQVKMIGVRAGRVPAKQAGRGESPRQCLDSPGCRHHHWGGLLASGPESLTILGPRAGVVREPDRGPRSPVTSPADRGRPPTRETAEFLAGMRRAPGARTHGPSFTESFSTLLRSPPPLRDMGRGHAGGPRCDRRTRRRMHAGDHGLGRNLGGGRIMGSEGQARADSARGRVPSRVIIEGVSPGGRRRAVPDQADRRRGGRRLGRHLRRRPRRPRGRPAATGRSGPPTGTRSPMIFLVNDRWTGRFTVTQPGLARVHDPGLGRPLRLLAQAS